MSNEDSSVTQSDEDFALNEAEESSEIGWVQWYCSLEGHDFLAEVTEEYLHDNSNLYGLKSNDNHFNNNMD